MTHLQRILLTIFGILFLMSSLACKSSQGVKDFPIGVTIDELMSNLSGKYEQVDSIKYWPQFSYNSASSQKLPDTAVRFAPFNFKNRSGILLARIKDNRVQRYDLVYDNFVTWKNRMEKINGTDAHQRHPYKDDLYWTFLNRQFSSKKEYYEILTDLKKEYGEPDQIIDSNKILYTWNKRNMALRSINNETTTIISFYSSGDSPMLQSDWQFSNIIPDSTLYNIKLGTDKKILKNTFNFRDTLIVSDDILHSSGGTIELYSWGIPGKLSFIFDSLDRLSRLQWLGVGTGNRLYIGTYIFVYLNIYTLLRNSIETKAKKDEMVKIRLHDKIDGDTFLTYYDPYHIEFIKCDSTAGEAFITY